MKTLVEYIREAAEENAVSSKSFTFNFAPFDKAEDTIKALQEIEADGVNVEVDDNKVSITVPSDNAEAASKLFELLQDYVQDRRNDGKFSSDEQYAQKVSKFEKTVNSYYDWVDELSAEDEDDKKDDEDKKEEE